MSRRYGSSAIPVAVFLSLLLMVLPVSADNVTPQTNITTTETTIAITPTTEVTTPTTTVAITPTTEVTTPTTTVTTPATTIATTKKTTTAPKTSPATTRKTVTPVKTTVNGTRPVSNVTTVIPTVSVTETGTTGAVMVYSSPAGASILIDGVYCGTTPLSVNDLPAGNHILRLSLSGYHDYEGSIYIVAGQKAQGYGTLQPLILSAAPTPVPTMVVPVIVPVVTASNETTQDTGLLQNPNILVAIIGVMTALIAAGATVLPHIRPPKK